jgi:hypothetical protein
LYTCSTSNYNVTITNPGLIAGGTALPYMHAAFCICDIEQQGDIDTFSRTRPAVGLSEHRREYKVIRALSTAPGICNNKLRDRAGSRAGKRLAECEGNMSGKDNA